MLATDFTTAFKAHSCRQRARWAAYLVTEYEPAQITSPESRDQARRSYELGLDLLALDPAVASCLTQAGGPTAMLLPRWVEQPAIELDRCHEPRSLLVIGTSRVPDHSWDEMALALEWTGLDHRDLRILTCGAPHALHKPKGARWQNVPSINEPEFSAILHDRPICVVIYPSGEPIWLHDLVARGCAVIAVAACLDQTNPEAEYKEGVIRVPANGRMIAQAIDSLLIDQVRFGALTARGCVVVKGMPRPIEAARSLLREFRNACAPDLKVHHEGQVEIVDDLRFEVA